MKCERCDKPSVSRGLCTTHYQKWRRALPDRQLRSYNPVKGTNCLHCDKPATAKQLCPTHYKAQQRKQAKENK